MHIEHVLYIHIHAKFNPKPNHNEYSYCTPSSPSNEFTEIFTDPGLNMRAHTYKDALSSIRVAVYLQVKIN